VGVTEGITGGLFLTMGVAAGVEEEEEEEGLEERSMHFGEFCRLTVTSEEFECEATRAATARAATARRWRA